MNVPGGQGTVDSVVEQLESADVVRVDTSDEDFDGETYQQRKALGYA